MWSFRARRPSPPLPRRPSGGTLLARYWRGDVGLAASFWIVGLLGYTAIAALVAGVVFFLRGRDFNPVLLLAALAAVWLSIVAGTVIHAVAVWRAARRYRLGAKPRSLRAVWAIAAQVVVVLAPLAAGAELARSGLAQLADLADMVLFDDPKLPPYSVRLMREGTEMEIAGGFKYGLGRDVERIAATTPNLKLVHLNSDGGRLGEAEKIARLIFRRGLSTYSAATCSSACAVAFMAGNERWLKDGARIGFHRDRFAGDETSGGMRAILTNAGLDPAFVERAVSTPASGMWYPSPDELKAVRVITAVVDNSRFAVSGYGIKPDIAHLETALRRSPVFAAIEAIEPETFAGIADTFHRGYAAGTSEGELLERLQTSRVLPLVRVRLPQADDALLTDYAHLLADQYDALGNRNLKACFDYAARGSDRTIAGLMPPALRQREEELIARALRATERRMPATDDTVQAIYRTVSERLGTRHSAANVRLLADPARVQPVQYSAYCSMASAMFRTIADLPPASAGDVMSHVLARTGAATRSR